ncbi:MAG: glucosaminidase domain-containing protein [Candidatus Pelagibacter bacterium]|jgi:Bax protein|nr:glucosaminidase domain-containing protein [Candidatus Pelagibacter bacterium]|tara:strand:+ start:1202 stop:2341 length:1140 start_codon:yes stop_codon:yes gene_type:complete
MAAKKKLYVSRIKKILLKKGYKIYKGQTKSIHKDLKSFYYTTIAGIFLVSFFSLTPKALLFTSKIFSDPVIVENTSKMDFEKILNGKKELNLKSEEKEKISFEDMYSDIEKDFDDFPSDIVRFSAPTLNQLFKDTKYSLKEVRKTKLVNPGNSINLLPKEIKQIENTKKRKEFFIRIVLPLILEENYLIRLDRKKLFVILNKNNNTESEQKWLKSKFKKYGVVNRDFTTLKMRMDEIPVSLAIAQAAKETGWGTSRFALEGNALFGQWTWSGEGIKPASADSDSKHKVMKFKVLQASVRAYQRNLNTHSSYRKFREARAIQRDNDGKLNSLELVKYLDKYAETGKEYTVVLKKIIKQNSLTDFDGVKLLPSSEKLKKLI